MTCDYRGLIFRKKEYIIWRVLRGYQQDWEYWNNRRRRPNSRHYASSQTSSVLAVGESSKALRQYAFKMVKSGRSKYTGTRHTG